MQQEKMRQLVIRHALSFLFATIAIAWSTPLQAESWLDKLSGETSNQLAFVQAVPFPDGLIPGINRSIEPDKSYVELYLESLRLSKSRSFATKFRAVVHSFVTLNREGRRKATLASISVPNQLADLDGRSLDRVITVSKQMMGPIAYRGGPISLQLGLFSVKNGDLISPLIDYLLRISETAGTSYVTQARPFLPLITEGIDLIAGQKADVALQVGLDTEIQPRAGSVLAIIDLPLKDVDASSINLDENYQLLLDGRPLEASYAVFSIRSTDKKSDFGEVPELSEKFIAVEEAIQTQNKVAAEEAFVAFRLAVITSPDLIRKDQLNLIKKVQEKIDFAFESQSKGSDDRIIFPKTLSEIDLYWQR